MCFVITGATGHIGNNLVRFINERLCDAEISVLIRRDGKAIEGTFCRRVFGDICNKDLLSENISSGDVVIHLAAFIDLTDKKYDEMYRINYVAAKNICDVCLEKNARFIYVGSVDAIAKDGEGKISEPEDYFPEKIVGGYGKTKAMASKYILGKMREYPDFSAAIVLPSAVIGINDFKPSAVGKVLENILDGRPEFGIRGGYNFVDVRDVCDVIFRLSQTRLTGQYIVSGENVTVKELYERVNGIIGRNSRPIILPTALVLPFLPFVKVLNKITLKSLTEPHDYDCGKAETDLGFSKTPISKTFSDTVAWFDSRRHLDKNSYS